jgi:hypothetical protein
MRNSRWRSTRDTRQMKEKLEAIFKEMQLHPAGLTSEQQEEK